MSVVQSSAEGSFSSEECSRLVGYYITELRKLQSKYEEFLKQKFTFVRAIQRDHETTGSTRWCIDSVATLQLIRNQLQQTEFANKIDVDVVSLLLQLISETFQLIQGFIQFYFQIR